MREMARVLKPGGWATVVFHNTDAGVWKVIRDAAEGAGFISTKRYPWSGSSKATRGIRAARARKTWRISTWSSICATGTARSEPHAAEERRPEKNSPQVLKDRSASRHGLQGVHAEVMRRLASDGSAPFVDYSDVRKVYQKLTRKGKAGRTTWLNPQLGPGSATSRV